MVGITQQVSFHSQSDRTEQDTKVSAARLAYQLWPLLARPESRSSKPFAAGIEQDCIQAFRGFIEAIATHKIDFETLMTQGWTDNQFDAAHKSDDIELRIERSSDGIKVVTSGQGKDLEIPHSVLEYLAAYYEVSLIFDDVESTEIVGLFDIDNIRTQVGHRCQSEIAANKRIVQGEAPLQLGSGNSVATFNPVLTEQELIEFFRNKFIEPQQRLIEALKRTKHPKYQGPLKQLSEDKMSELVQLAESDWFENIVSLVGFFEELEGGPTKYFKSKLVTDIQEIAELLGRVKLGHDTVVIDGKRRSIVPLRDEDKDIFNQNQREGIVSKLKENRPDDFKSPIAVRAFIQRMIHEVQGADFTVLETYEEIIRILRHPYRLRVPVDAIQGTIARLEPISSFEGTDLHAEAYIFAISNNLDEFLANRSELQGPGGCESQDLMPIFHKLCEIDPGVKSKLFFDLRDHPILSVVDSSDDFLEEYCFGMGYQPYAVVGGRYKETDTHIKDFHSLFCSRMFHLIKDYLEE